MIFTFIFLPFFLALVRMCIRSEKVGYIILLLGAITHFILTIFAWIYPPVKNLSSWFVLDDIGLIILTVSSILFLMVVIYLIDFFKHNPTTRHTTIMSHSTPKMLSCCLLFFLSTLSLLCCTQHIGLFWIGLEATTFATAPLIYYYHCQRALESAWKYILICSVGIGMALVGNILISIAAPPGSGMTLYALLLDVNNTNANWFNAAYVFFLIGFGTKMGLVPMHTWLPEAHGEAPAPVSALLSAVLLNGAFLGILRMHQLSSAMGQLSFSQPLLLFFGITSILVAAFFIIAQRDYKRMLAYSSIEHMGILTLGLGLGGEAIYFVFLHLMNHSFIKGALFLISGNIYRLTHSKIISSLSNLRTLLPVSSVLWLIGLFAISAFPPFGLFIAELNTLRLVFSSEYAFLGILLLFGLFIIFSAMSYHFLRMLRKDKTKRPSLIVKESFSSTYPIIILLFLSLVLGCYTPDFLIHTFDRIVELFSAGGNICQ